MQDNVTRAVDWFGPLEAYHPDGRCFPVVLDRSDHHVRYLSYHPFGETVYYDDGTAYDDDSEWRVRNCLASTTAQTEAVQKLVDALEKAIAFYDNLSRPHDEGEAKLLDEMAAILAAHRESQP